MRARVHLLIDRTESAHGRPHRSLLQSLQCDVIGLNHVRRVLNGRAGVATHRRRSDLSSRCCELACTSNPMSPARHLNAEKGSNNNGVVAEQRELACRMFFDSDVSSLGNLFSTSVRRLLENSGRLVPRFGFIIEPALHGARCSQGPAVKALHKCRYPTLLSSHDHLFNAWRFRCTPGGMLKRIQLPELPARAGPSSTHSKGQFVKLFLCESPRHRSHA